ncbi:MAG TPA: DUF3109 family protein [Acidobacteriota bacterium]|nr:DUF3109 family protein [Acidobacteriota bacterium]
MILKKDSLKDSLRVNGIVIDPGVLRKSAFYSCAEIDCMADCCSGGVWVENKDVSRILEWAGAIKQCLPPDRHDESKWFDVNKTETGTEIVDDPMRPDDTCCIFLQKNRKCALQAVSMANNLGWPGIKPFYCAIYPFYCEDGVMSVDDETELDEETAGCRHAAPQTRRIIDLYRDEAILILGRSGYDELCEIAAEQEAAEQKKDAAMAAGGAGRSKES